MGRAKPARRTSEAGGPTHSCMLSSSTVPGAWWTRYGVWGVWSPWKLTWSNRCSRPRQRRGTEGLRLASAQRTRRARDHHVQVHRPANLAAAAIPELAYCSPMGALGSKLTASRHLAQMANADQVKALVRSHAKGDDNRFYAIALRVAERAARSGQGHFAQELSRSRRRPAEGSARSVWRVKGGGVVRRIVLLSALILVGVGVAAGPRALAGSGSSGAAGPSVSITHFGAPVSGALGIVLGPDGALWFTNSGNDSIGRITTGGKISTYRDASISDPWGIVVGPDGALWFTNSGNDSIGRITTDGQDQQLPGREHQRPDGDRARAGRRPLVHQQRQRLDRADHDRRARSAPTATRASAPRGGSRSGRTAPSGSPTAATTRSGGSRPAARSAATGTRASATRGGSRPGRTAPSGSPTTATTRSGGSRPTGKISTYRGREHQQPVRDRARAGRRPLVHQQRQRLDRADHDRRQDQHLHGTRASATRAGSPLGPDGALWFTNSGNDSIGRITTTRQDQQLPRTRASATRRGSRCGPDGALWFTNSGNDSIGRITTGGKISTYRNASIRDPRGIAPGPDGALWFTNSGNDSIGRITTTGKITHLPRRGHQLPEGDRARAGRRALVHQPRQRLDRADHDQRARSAATGTRASSTRGGSRSGRTAPSGSPTASRTRSGGSRPRARSAATGTRASASRGGSRSGRTAPSGSPTTAPTRSGGSRPRARSAATAARASASRTGSCSGRMELSGSPTATTTRSGGSRPRARSAPTGTRASATRGGSRSGRTAPSGSPTTATTRSGARRSSRATDDAARPPGEGTWPRYS